jgi:hypothetical protein
MKVVGDWYGPAVPMDPLDPIDTSTSSAPYSYVPIDEMNRQVAASLGITSTPAGSLSAANLTTTIATAVATAVAEGMAEATTEMVAAIQNSTTAIVASTDNNTQVIASTVVDTTADQVNANRLGNNAIYSYKRTDLGLMAID